MNIFKFGNLLSKMWTINQEGGNDLFLQLVSPWICIIAIEKLHCIRGRKLTKHEKNLYLNHQELLIFILTENFGRNRITPTIFNWYQFSHIMIDIFPNLFDLSEAVHESYHQSCRISVYSQKRNYKSFEFNRDVALTVSNVNNLKRQMNEKKLIENYDERTKNLKKKKKKNCMKKE